MSLCLLSSHKKVGRGRGAERPLRGVQRGASPSHRSAAACKAFFQFFCVVRTPFSCYNGNTNHDICKTNCRKEVSSMPQAEKAEKPVRELLQEQSEELKSYIDR